MNRAIVRGMGLSLAAVLAFAPALVMGGLEGVVNINTATSEQLELLPNVGEVRARAIIEHRKQHGPFKSVGELEAVSGIGEKAIGEIGPHCVLTGQTTAQRE
ncbi:MAG: helix-hairpin-helix domain-containing protein [Deltaproteobacteria bacterium]|nr:helix-hairpin-helix domain-containing protein [Deltaproteobacteria bacterium]MBW2414516.1 helix-hairpin-helix domain-containing protein [Deltaproteobacteria bacterium]